MAPPQTNPWENIPAGSPHWASAVPGKGLGAPFPAMSPAQPGGTQWQQLISCPSAAGLGEARAADSVAVAVSPSWAGLVPLGRGQPLSGGPAATVAGMSWAWG